MPDTLKIEIDENVVFNKKYYGIHGKIGSGANAEILYVQSTLKMKDLHDFQLIADIPGSERWNVRDLFQRNINTERIEGEGGLLDYFKNKNSIKYFNPIALVVLPQRDNKPLTTLPLLMENKNEGDLLGLDESKLSTLNWEDYYQFTYLYNNDVNLSKIAWNSEKCSIVAVDGQHRLTALKRLYDFNKNTNDNNIKDWKIPVVFLIPRKLRADLDSDNLIEIIRKIFMYINMKAENVNESRAILLDDENINSICVQEIIDHIHSQDFNTLEDQENTRKHLPLYMVNWMGLETDKKKINDTMYVLSNKELKSWLDNYLLGSEEKIDSTSLCWKRLAFSDEEFETLEDDVPLNNNDAQIIRNKFNSTMREAFLKFITNLDPIKNYIKEASKYEKDILKDPKGVKALDILRYGYGTFDSNDLASEVKDYSKKIADTLKNKKISAFKSFFFRADICLRGFIFAFSEFYNYYKEDQRRAVSWNEYTEKIIPLFNEFISEGWTNDVFENEITDNQKDLLIHICYDPSGTIINYRLEDVKKAWGIFVLMHILYLANKNDPNFFQTGDEVILNAWSTVYPDFFNTLEKGIKKQVRAELQQKALTKKERDKEIRTKSKNKADNKLLIYQKLWGINEEVG